MYNNFYNKYCSLTAVLKSLFHLQGNDVRDGLVYPILHAASTLNNKAATWLQASPSLQVTYILHQTSKNKLNSPSHACTMSHFNAGTS